MSDLDIIKEIEKILNIELTEVHKMQWYSRCYNIINNSDVTGVGLYGCNIDNNKLIHIIPLLKELKSLKVLYLHFNQINNIYHLNELACLTQLDLRGNQISDISPLRELKNLTLLILRDNQISDISPLTELMNLILLDLRENQISDISNLRNLFHKNDIYLDVSRNPLNKPPLEIVKQGKEAIRNYFAQLEKQGKDYIYEAKLMIVGEPGAGKTSLMNKLFDKNYPVPNNLQKSTLGIEVKQNWGFCFGASTALRFRSGRGSGTDIGKGINYKAHLWDFGGQQVQYMLHQFFLTTDCVYLLMAEKRRELTNFDYWLNIINVLGKNSPVIVLFNEINIESANSFIYDEKKYKELFPGMQLEKLDVNLADITDGRFDALVSTIKKRLSGLPHIGKEVPARWVDIRRELEYRKDKKHIHINEYFEICQKYDITKEDDRIYILKYFHILGIVLWFSDDDSLRDILFLDPNWTIDAVYAVLTDTDIQNNFGLFKKEKVEKLWEKKGYSYEERTKLFQLMLKDNFELCYRLPGDGGEYLVPMLLCKVRSEYVWENKDNLQFRFQYPFMPKGIVSRLIVRMNEYTEHDKVWNEGAVFSKGGARAQVIEKETTKEGLKIIEIRLTGTPDKRKELLTLIREEIRKIQSSSFPALPFYEMVPCNCKECAVKPEPYFYAYNDLQKYIEKNKKTIECRDSTDGVSITALIGAIFTKKEENKKTKNMKKNQTTVKGNKNIIIQGAENSVINVHNKTSLSKDTEKAKKIKTITQKEKEGYQSQLNLLVEKKFNFEKELIITDSASKKFELKQQIKEIEGQITDLKGKKK